MTSLAINDNNDLCFKDYRLKLVSGNDEILQRVKIRLRFFKNEWFLNTEHGIPYYQDILGKKKVDINVVQSIFKENILDIEDINSIIEFELGYNSSNRQLILDFKATDIDGNIIEETITV